MGKNIFELVEKGKVIKRTEVSIYDFTPIVTISEDEKKGNNTFIIDKESKREIFNLGSNINAKYREYKVPNILITKNETTIFLKVFNGNTKSGFVDDDGLLEFYPSVDGVSVEYESKIIEYGDIVKIKIKHTLKIGEDFSIEIKARDNQEDFIKVSDKVIIVGKLNFKVKEFLTDIPSIILCNFDCEENCTYTSETDAPPPALIWEEGIKNPLIKKGLELFSKTSQGQYFLKLFLCKDTNLFSFKCSSNGKYYNKHSLMFIENDYEHNFGHTEYDFRSRFPDYKTLRFSDYILKSTKIISRKIKKNSDKYYMNIQIHLYVNQFLEAQKSEKWSDDRLITVIAHTIAHEAFIHAYRKGILCMEKWGNNFKQFDKIYYRSTGNHGDVDHTDYINNKSDKGMDLMRGFQKELKKKVGIDLFTKVKKYHDKKYNHLKKI